MPRFVLLILVCLIGIAAQLVLALKFQSYRAGALVLVAFAAVAVLIFRFMPAAPAEKKWLANRSPQEITRPIRRLAYLYIFRNNCLCGFRPIQIASRLARAFVGRSSRNDYHCLPPLVSKTN